MISCYFYRLLAYPERRIVGLRSEAIEQRDAAKNRVLDLERQLSSAKRTLQDREEELAAAAVRDDQLGGRLISAAEALSSELPSTAPP